MEKKLRLDANGSGHVATTPSGPQNTGMFDRITFDPKVLGGRACIRGMRIPVSVIVSQVAHGASQEEILKDYPDLEPEDVRQAMEYAAWLASEEVHPASR